MMETRNPQLFDVPPPPAWAWWLLVALGGLLPLGIIATLWLTRAPGVHGVAPALVIVPVVLGLLVLGMRRRSVLLRNGVLEVRAALYTRRVAASELDLSRAQVVNLHERTELKPRLKTNGYSIPGFDAGHFRLREHFGKAFCLLTERERVLWLPLRDGKTQILLSLERPQALLDALRAA
ncbi:MAG: hypothetical protein KGL91_00490 [Xanthomonadaceae bacterium]|nr:hypothetical protein [Xanthomonadaceae bacterium]